MARPPKRAEQPGSPRPRDIPLRHRGLTLIELLFVVAFLALLAATTLPVLLGTSHPTQARQGAERIAAALRFARDESLRTALPHGLAFSAGTDADSLKVFMLDTSTIPPTPLYTVLHPLSRQPYAETLGAGSPFPAARVGATPVITASGTTGQLHLSADGAPAILQGSSPLRLSGASVRIRVNAGEHSQSVLIATETGRVTLE